MMRPHYTWSLPAAKIELGKRTVIMGILNVTPDSFSDGGSYFEFGAAVERAHQIAEEGAHILDIGGESSRPGSEAVPVEEEIRRVIPLIDALHGKLRIPISIDTYRATVARQALEAGAQIVNDISGFRFDPDLPAVVREYAAGVVLMHSRGDRDALHLQQPMVDPMGEILGGLRDSIDRALAASIPKSAIVIDPGIGFGKTASESLLVLGNLRAFSPLQYPLLIGASRKSFLRKIAPESPEARLWGTAAAVGVSVWQGAHIARVHDVRQMRALLDVIDAIGAASPLG